MKRGVVQHLLAWMTIAALCGASGTARADGSSRSGERTDQGSESVVEPTEETEERGYETASVGEEDYFSAAHRRELYRKGRLSYGRAVMWTAILPGLGNFYAEQYFLGGLNMSTIGFTALLIPYGLVTDQSGFIWAGVGLAGLGYISGFATSYYGVRKFNRQLRRELRISTHSGGLESWRRTPWSAPSAATFGLRIRFR